MTLAKQIPYGSDVSAGKFQCVDCGNEIMMQSKSSLPPCPKTDDGQHTTKAWRALSGQGDAASDPYPAQSKTK